MVYYWTFFFFFNLTKTKGSTLLEIILVMLLDPELKQCCSVTIYVFYTCTNGSSVYIYLSWDSFTQCLLCYSVPAGACAECRCI